MPRNLSIIWTIVLGPVCFFLSSCATGPKRENDSALDYLNGHNYQAGSPVGIGPSVKRQAPARAVSGMLLINSDPLPLPLKYQMVVLTQNGNEIARSMTDSNGEFVLTGDISSGTYTVAIDSSKYVLSQTLVVSGYKTEGLRFIATVITH